MKLSDVMFYERRGDLFKGAILGNVAVGAGVSFSEH